MAQKESETGKRAPKDWAELRTETLLQESDRGCVIFGAQILSDALEDLLRACGRSDTVAMKKHVDPLFRGYAPLATYFARSQLCYALKFIDHESFRVLEAVRKMRNIFAHSAESITFSDKRCVDILRFLIAGGKPEKPDPSDSVMVPFGAQKVPKKQAVNRIAFTIAVTRCAEKIRSLAKAAREDGSPRWLVEAYERKHRDE